MWLPYWLHQNEPELVELCSVPLYLLIQLLINLYVQCTYSVYTGDVDELMIFDIQALFRYTTEKYDLVYDFPRIHRVVSDIVPIDDGSRVLL
jgi:hypothetical protein